MMISETLRKPSIVVLPVEVRLPESTEKKINVLQLLVIVLLTTL